MPILSSMRTALLGLCLTAASAVAAQAADAVSFMIDWLPAGDKAAIYYGVESGIFAKADLDVTISVGRGSSDVVTKLATGAADLGYGGLPALLQAVAKEKVPVKAVMSVYTVQPDAIFTTNESGIGSLKDLAGKRVATASFSSSNVVWPLLLEKNGLSPDSIQLLKVDPGALAPMLATGQIDATINWLTAAPPFEAALGEVGKSLRTLPWSQFGFNGYGLSIFASDKMLTERPDVLKRFLAAYLKANEAAIADPEAAAAAIKARVPDIDAAIARKQWEASIPLMVNDVSAAAGMGTFEPSRLAETWDWVARSQNLDAGSLDPKTVIAIGLAK